MPDRRHLTPARLLALCAVGAAVWVLAGLLVVVLAGWSW